MGGAHPSGKRLDLAKDAFVDWLRVPKDDRAALGLPVTQREFANLWGCRTETLTRWRKTVDVKEETVRRSFASVSASDIEMMWLKQVEQAKAGKIGSVKFVFEMCNLLKSPDARGLREDMDPAISRDEIGSMSDDELEKLLAGMG